MFIKIIVLLLLLIIIGSMASGLYYLMKDKGTSTRTVKALTIRISLSILAFLLIIVGFLTGLIQPGGIIPR